MKQLANLTLLGAAKWASRLRVMLALVMAALLHSLAAPPVLAQELLANRSFELPAGPNAGNNLYASVPSWTIAAQGNTDSSLWNIIRPFSGYCCNQALTTPSGGGSQYLDINGTWAQIRQTVTMTQAGTVRFSGWFSTRDGTTALTGSALYLKNTAGTTLATVAVTFTSADPAGSWKQGVSGNIWLPAGTYYFEAYIPNPANFDLASVYRQPTYSLGSPTTMRQCPAAPQQLPGTLAGWNSNAPANTQTQDGYYDSNWQLRYWTIDGTGADLSRLAGQPGALSFGPGLASTSAGTVQNLKPVNGTWAASVPTLAAAIGAGSYVQVRLTTADSYEASRLALYGSHNFYHPSGTYRQAGYISTAADFSTYTELFRDQAVSTNLITPTLRPLLAKGTTYYVRLYFYDVTATSNADGTVIWDDWHIAGGACSAISPVADSGSAMSANTQIVLANIAANDLVNGWDAVLGSTGNATITRQGTWPAGILLDEATGALSINPASQAGTYTLAYRLCDTGGTPVCSDAAVSLTLLPQLTVSKVSTVVSDPVNGTASPRAIPGSLVRYCIVVANPSGNPTATSVTLTDVLSAQPVNFQNGSLRINAALPSGVCDYAAGSPGGTHTGGTIAATLPDLPGGSYAGLYYDVIVQ